MPQTRECTNPAPPASGSNTSIASSSVPGGGALQRRSGRAPAPAPAHVYSVGMVARSANAELVSVIPIGFVVDDAGILSTIVVSEPHPASTAATSTSPTATATHRTS